MDILIVEDDTMTLTVLQHNLENLRHKVYSAKNGEQTVQMILSKSFDLLIIDMMMPGISGLSLVSVLRLVHLCTTPIIMMSTLNNKPLFDAAFKAGANDYLVKPFSVEDLSGKIKKISKSVIP